MNELKQTKGLPENVVKVLGREYRIATPNIRYPAIAKSHFFETNAAVGEYADLDLAWKTLCDRVELHNELAARAAVGSGYPIEGETLVLQNGAEWAVTLVQRRSPMRLSQTGVFNLNEDGALAFNGSEDKIVEPNQCESNEGEYQARVCQMFSGAGVGQYKVWGALWVRVFNYLGDY